MEVNTTLGRTAVTKQSDRDFRELSLKNCSRIKTNVSPTSEYIYVHIDYENYIASVAVVGNESFGNQVMVIFFNKKIPNNKCSIVKLNSNIGRFSVLVNNIEHFSREVVASEHTLMSVWENDCVADAYKSCALEHPKTSRTWKSLLQVNVTGCE